MREFNPNKKNDGQFNLDLPIESEVIASNDNEQYDDVTHLGPDDLIKMQVDEPEEYEAFMTEIERQRKLIEQEKELEKIERLAIEAEVKEIDEKRKNELRTSIVKAIDNRNADEDRETACGDIYDAEEYAKRKKEKKDRDEIEKLEEKRKWWQSKKRHKK